MSAIPFQGVTFDNLLPSLGDAMLSAFGTIASAPRRALWDVGPSLVGRSGQGPQTGTEMLGRLGMDRDSGLTQALGFGAEVAGDPLTMMSALGHAGRAAPAVADGAGNIAQRLEQFAGQGLTGTLASRPASGSLGGLSQVAAHSPPPVPSVAAQMAARGPAPAAARLPRPDFKPVARGPAWGGNLDPSTFGYAPGVSPSFLQPSVTTPGITYPSVGYPNFPTPLATQSLMTPAGGAQQSGQLADRLQRLIGR